MGLIPSFRCHSIHSNVILFILMSFHQSKLILTLFPSFWCHSTHFDIIPRILISFYSFRCHSIRSDVIPSFYSHSVIHVSFDVIPVSFHWVAPPQKKKYIVSISFYSHSV